MNWCVFNQELFIKPGGCRNYFLPYFDNTVLKNILKFINSDPNNDVRVEFCNASFHDPYTYPCLISSPYFCIVANILVYTHRYKVKHLIHIKLVISSIKVPPAQYVQPQTACVFD